MAPAAEMPAVKWSHPNPLRLLVENFLISLSFAPGGICAAWISFDNSM